MSKPIIFDKYEKKYNYCYLLLTFIIQSVLSANIFGNTDIIKKRAGITTISVTLLLVFMPTLASAKLPLPKIATYLPTNAPTFNFTLQQFIDEYNSSNEQFPFPTSCKEVKSINYRPYNQYYVCTINDTFYASIVANRLDKRIKTFQMTYISPTSYRNDDINPLILRYMSSLLQWLDVDIPPNESESKVLELLDAGTGQIFYQETDNQLRYIVADHNEKGITLALEPLESKISNNK